MSRRHFGHVRFGAGARDETRVPTAAVREVQNETSRRQFLPLARGAAALPAVSRIARAQIYPSQPVRLIAPATAGGASDILARLMGQWLSDRLGQQFIIDNRPGAGNNTGTEAVVRA
jgi:hypothetical protein